MSKQEAKNLTIQDLSSENAWHYENGFFLFSNVKRLGKVMAHYELYKRITHLPGDVLELGVYKGVSLMQWLTFRELLESKVSRKIIGFDTFDHFPKSGDRLDEKFVKDFVAAGGEPLSREELQQAIESKGLWNNVELIAGEVCEELEDFLCKSPQRRFSLVHVDVDIYEPTKAALAACWNRIVPQGLLVLDDYPTVNGACRAVDEFLESEGVGIQKLPLSHVPAFVVKPGTKPSN